MVREMKKKATGTPKVVKDFKKRKAKVGKKAVDAASKTSTKFSAKRIAMPGQSVLKDRSVLDHALCKEVT